MKKIWSVLTAAALGLPLLGAWTSPASATQPLGGFVSTTSPTYQTNGIAWAVAQSNGLVFVGGTFSSVRPPSAAAGTGELPRADLVALNADTGSPTSCAPTIAGNPTSTDPVSVRSLAVSPDGRTLYIGGFFSSVAGVQVFNLAALDIATCSVVPSFAPTPNGTVRTILATSQSVYFGGDFVNVQQVSHPHAGAAVPVGVAGTGSLLAWSPSFDLAVRALAASPDGSGVVVGGDFTTVNGLSTHALVVVDPMTGANSHIFPTGFIPARSVVKDLTIDASGFYTGQEGTGGGVLDGRIAIDWGTYAQRWRDTCLGATQAVVVYHSILYSGSHGHDCSSMSEFPNGARHHLLAEPVSQPTLIAWSPQTNDGIGEMVGPRDMVVAPTPSHGDYLWVVGEFTTVNGVAQQGITRFGTGADTSSPSVSTTSVSSPAPGVARVAWRQAIDTDDATLTYRVYRDSSSTPLQTVQGTSWFWQRPQLSVTDSGLVPGSRHAYRVDASDGSSTWAGVSKSVTISSSSSAYADRVLSDGASFLWRYDDPCDVLVSDASSSNNNGTLQGSSTCQVAGALVGDPSAARTLSGTTTIYTETAQSWASTASFTSETWVRTTTTSGGKLIGLGDNQGFASSVSDKHVYMTNSGTLAFGVVNAGKNVAISSPSPYNDGAWHLVDATLGSSGLALYVDGRLVASNPSVTTSRAYNRAYWRVGGDTVSSAWPGFPSTGYLSGSLDETAVYPTALSAATVQSHYAAGKGLAGTG